MCVRLMREAGIDGIRLDSLGFYFWPCYNPSHNHASPFDYNIWLQELYAKVAEAVRAVKPDALLSTEAPADFNHRHFNHSLHQISKMEFPYALGEDVSPLRVALPSYRLHSGAGVAGTSLQLQPLWLAPGADEAPWLAAFSAARETLCDGDPTLPDPDVSPSGMLCRRVTGKGEDVITGARVAWIDDPEAPHRLPLARNCAESMIVMPLSYEPEAAWLFDLEGRELSDLEWKYEDGVLGFKTSSNWFMALVVKRVDRPPCWISIPAEVSRGRDVTLTVRSPGLQGSGTAQLRIPGWVNDPVEIAVPGNLTLSVPGGMAPAWYRAELESQVVRPTVCLFRITP
jgi:hypothetical protein